VNILRSRGSWVATPTGQVFKWHTRIITQPSVTSGAVANPNSSAPSSAATTTSRPGLQLPVGLDHDPAAQVVQEQGLVGLGQPEFPGQPRVLDAGLRRRPGPAIVSADQHHVRMRLRHAGRDGAHARPRTPA
jgi:hypothetical protein